MNVQKPEELDEQPEDISDLDDEEEDRLPPRSEHCGFGAGYRVVGRGVFIS